jgi:hypothetical protein
MVPLLSCGVPYLKVNVATRQRYRLGQKCSPNCWFLRDVLQLLAVRVDTCDDDFADFCSVKSCGGQNPSNLLPRYHNSSSYSTQLLLFSNYLVLRIFVPNKSNDDATLAYCCVAQ